MLITALPSDVKFLRTLDDKLHYTIPSSYQKNKWSVPEPIIAHRYYTNANMETAEAERLLRIVKRSALILYPEISPGGFLTLFCVRDPLTQNDVLRFLEKQLPPEFDWNTMKSVFMRPVNYALGWISKLDIRDDHAHYDY